MPHRPPPLTVSLAGLSGRSASRQFPAEIGWRKDRPFADPEKMKRWGLVSAQPSEYRIHFRRGEIREKTTGRGKTCFKLPYDDVGNIPTNQ